MIDNISKEKNMSDDSFLKIFKQTFYALDNETDGDDDTDYKKLYYLLFDGIATLVDDAENKSWNYYSNEYLQTLDELKNLILTADELFINMNQAARIIHIHNDMDQNNFKTNTYAPFIFDDIIVPPDYQNTKICDMEYRNDTLGARISNALDKNGIRYLKDLRYKRQKDIRLIREIGEKSYNCFIEALKRTVLAA